MLAKRPGQQVSDRLRGRHINPGLFVIPPDKHAQQQAGCHEDYVEVAVTTSHKGLKELEKR